MMEKSARNYYSHQCWRSYTALSAGLKHGKAGYVPLKMILVENLQTELPIFYKRKTFCSNLLGVKGGLPRKVIPPRFQSEQAGLHVESSVHESTAIASTYGHLRLLPTPPSRLDMNRIGRSQHCQNLSGWQRLSLLNSAFPVVLKNKTKICFVGFYDLVVPKYLAF